MWCMSSKMNRAWNEVCDLRDYMNGICTRCALHEEEKGLNASV